MISEAVSFCTVVAFSLVVTNVWCRPTEEPKSLVRVAAKGSLQGNLFADRDGHIYLSAIPNVIQQDRKEQPQKQEQQLQQQQQQQQQQKLNQHYSEFTIGDGKDLNSGKKIIIVYKNENPKKVAQQKETVSSEKQKEDVNESEAGQGQQHKENVEYYGYPQYRFRYEVDDPKTKDRKIHVEERDGDKVTGKYALLEPDGHVRIVEYKADDKTGFNAIVSRDGNEIEF